MRIRAQAALVQLAVFVGGGIVAPAWHLSHHQADHTHGPDGGTVAFGLAAAEEPGHDHPHLHPHADAALAVHEHDSDHERDHEVEPTPVPTPLDHGHGSLAHFGLALLGAPPPLALPPPEACAWLPTAARTAALRLFLPSFPLPRPPPPARAV